MSTCRLSLLGTQSRRIVACGLLTFTAFLAFGSNAKAEDLPPVIRPVEAAAAVCRDASAAARIYAVALAKGSFSDEDRAAAEARRAHWLKLASEGRRRVGREWLSESEVESLEEEANRFIAQSFELIRLGNGKLAEDHLKEASRRFPESGQADMILGLIYGMVLGDSRKAAGYFSEVLKREPGNAYAMNNLAITALYEGKYTAASRSFRRALELMPDSQEICDNLAVTLGMVGAGGLRLPEAEVEAFSDLYRTAIHDLGLKPYQPRSAGGGGAAGSAAGASMPPGAGPMLDAGGLAGARGPGGMASSPPGVAGGSSAAGAYGGGYGGGGSSGGPAAGGAAAGGGGGAVGYTFFSPFGRPMLYGTVALDAATMDRLLDDPEEMVPHVWSGTGVAVGDGYVLTTKAAVGDATKVLIRNPDDFSSFLEADVAASLDETGLVLVDCPNLEIPGMPMAAGDAAAGGKVLLGGFSGGLSTRLSGAVTAASLVPRASGASDLLVALPKRENADAFRQGGLVVDASGGLIGFVDGLVASGVAAEGSEQAAGGYGVGPSAAAIRAFLDQELDDKPATASQPLGGWPEVASAVSKSTVFVYAKKVRPGKPQPEQPPGFAGAGPGGPSGFGGGFGGLLGSGMGTGFGSSPPGGYGSMPPGGMLPPGGMTLGSSPQGYGSQPPGTSPQGYGSQPPGSGSLVGFGSQPPGTSPQGYGSQPPGSQPPGSMGPGRGPVGMRPAGMSPGGSSPQGGYGSSPPPGSSPQGGYGGSQPPGSSPQGGYGSSPPPGSSPQGGYGSSPPPQGSSPQGGYGGSPPPGSSPPGSGSQPPSGT